MVLTIAGWLARKGGMLMNDSWLARPQGGARGGNGIGEHNPNTS